MKQKKGIDGKLDKAWSELIKLRAGMKCEIQGCTHKPTLNSHHIFTRKRASTRWDLDNGICLCVGHHTMSSKFSAHETPIAFTYWLEETKGSDWVNELMIKSNQTKKWFKFEKEELLEDLQNQISYLSNT